MRNLPTSVCVWDLCYRSARKQNVLYFSGQTFLNKDCGIDLILLLHRCHRVERVVIRGKILLGQRQETMIRDGEIQDSRTVQVSRSELARSDDLPNLSVAQSG